MFLKENASLLIPERSEWWSGMYFKLRYANWEIIANK